VESPEFDHHFKLVARRSNCRIFAPVTTVRTVAAEPEEAAGTEERFAPEEPEISGDAEESPEIDEEDEEALGD
jgi:hypothetical protein